MPDTDYAHTHNPFALRAMTFRDVVHHAMSAHPDLVARNQSTFTLRPGQNPDGRSGDAGLFHMIYGHDIPAREADDAHRRTTRFTRDRFLDYAAFILTCVERACGWLSGRFGLRAERLSKRARRIRARRREREARRG